MAAPGFFDGVALPDPRVGLVVRLVLHPVRLVVGLVLRLLRLVLETSLLWYFAIQFMITSFLTPTWVGALATQPLDPA